MSGGAVVASPPPTRQYGSAGDARRSTRRRSTQPWGKALVEYLDRYGPGEYRTVVSAPVRPTCPPPDPDKPYVWGGDEWLLAVTDKADE